MATPPYISKGRLRDPTEPSRWKMAKKRKAAKSEISGAGAASRMTLSQLSILEQPNIEPILHTANELPNRNLDDEHESRVGHELEMARLDTYLKSTIACMEGIRQMSTPKFNNEQCGYLSEKLESIVKSARLFIGDRQAQPNEMHPLMDMEMWAETFKLLLVLAKQVEGFFRDCGKDAWIHSALTLAHVGDYVSSIGLSLELCKGALRKEQGGTKILTMDEVGKLNEIEVENVKNLAFVDATSLFNMASAAANSSNMAIYLLSKLRGDVEDPYFDDDHLSHCMKLFDWVNLGKEKQIGAGASAKIYKVKWFGTSVAKKTFDGVNNQEFWREAKVLAQLHHPNITSMFCCNMKKRECSIIMELMDGSLYDLLRNRRQDEEFYPFSNLEGVDLMLQVGEGVNYLHKKNIVHRDLKSGNILVKRMEATDVVVEYIQVKVVDFGLSKTKETSISYSTMTDKGGTSRWVAPEIIRCNEVIEGSCVSSEKSPKYNFKGDIYSFGMVCYEILTGEVPFQNEESVGAAKKMVLRGLRPTIPTYCPPRLTKLIERCWSQDPKQRPCIGDVCVELKYFKYLLLMSRISQECYNLCKGDVYGVEEKKEYEKNGDDFYHKQESGNGNANLGSKGKTVIPQCEASGKTPEDELDSGSSKPLADPIDNMLNVDVLKFSEQGKPRIYHIWRACN